MPAGGSQAAPYIRSPWAPLRNPLYRALWFSTLVSNLGTWIHEVAGSWMMTDLRPEPWMVALVQVATTTPMFLLALPAGAMADVVDRRRYLLVTQSWMMLTALVMAVLAFRGQLDSSGLLLGTTILAIGTALNSPAWHAVLPSVVSRHTLPAAVNLNGLAISLARALGPAVAGLLLRFLTPAWGFALNTVSFGGILIVLWRWKPKQKVPRVRAERFLSALRVGIQHVQHSPRMRNVLVRISLFIFGSSALWSLLPLLVRRTFNLGADSYGAMVGLFGLGAAFSSTTWLPRVREKMTVGQMVDSHWLVFSLLLVALSQCYVPYLPFALIFLCGASWIVILSNLHFSVQSVVPAWVRSRAMSVYLLCYFAAASGGGVFFGRLAERVDLRTGLLSAGVMLLVSTLSGLRWPVRSGEDLDLQPSHHWPEPDLRMYLEGEQGPVLVTVEYRVRLDRADEFRAAMAAVKECRLQNGVLRWGLFVDIEDPELYREVYLEESWEAHLRQHDRVTHHEAQLAQKAYEFHIGAEPPKIQHLLLCEELTRIPV